MKKIFTLLFFLGITCFSYAAQFKISNGDINALKTAITTSNSNAAPDSIHLFPYGIYNFTTADNNFVFGNNALPRIVLDIDYTNTLTIFGNGAKLIIDTSVLDDTRILYITDGKIKFYDTGFINGRADYDGDPGGAILLNTSSSMTTVDFNNCLFKGNAAYEGGALYLSSGFLNINNCTFVNNDAMFLGSAITNMAGYINIFKSVFVHNISTNTSVPGAIYNYYALNSPSMNNIYLYGSIVALNTYQHPGHANHGQEYDLAENSGIYTSSSNVIGAYNNTTPGTSPTPFVIGSPTVNNDYVGSYASPIDPLLGTFARQGDYQQTYSLLPASVAKLNTAGNVVNTQPAIATIGLVPEAGPEGSELTIYGKNFTNIISFQFEGLPVSYTGFTKTDTSIIVTVPTGALSGKIKITDYNLLTLESQQIFTVGEIVVDGVQSKTKTEDFKFYPNPVTDYLMIDSDDRLTTILDLYGKELLTSKEEKINISAFRKGIYFIKCGEEVKKFVKE